ncbi:hypothetical protein TEQG_05576 [Trichophyton equinum CBS 127.97]|uniref:Uncharacterized protein n=1 Tax=Trichophyton equinum (strain ATCC MYA-4606 / CBS 127.97) TaxID=559882 RepID=F2PXG0_TRIEC|nr:hypothetical protein TEQG_05576 [Trichophyton equinum CBS 127.97]
MAGGYNSAEAFIPQFAIECLYTKSSPTHGLLGVRAKECLQVTEGTYCSYATFSSYSCPTHGRSASMHGQPIPQSGSLPSIDSFMDLSSPKSPPIGLGQSAFSPGQKPGRPQANSPPPHAQGSPSNQRTQQRIQGISTVQPKYFRFPNVNPNGPKALR